MVWFIILVIFVAIWYFISWIKEKDKANDIQKDPYPPTPKPNANNTPRLFPPQNSGSPVAPQTPSPSKKPVSALVSAMIELGVFLAKVSDEKAKKRIVINQIDKRAKEYSRGAMILITKKAGELFSRGGNALKLREMKCCDELRIAPPRSHLICRHFFVEILGAGSAVSAEELSAFLRIMRTIDNLNGAESALKLIIENLLLKLSDDAIDKHAFFLLELDDVPDGLRRQKLKGMMRLALAQKNKQKEGTEEYLRASMHYKIISIAKKKLS